MKTTNKHPLACTMTAVLWVALTMGTSAWAQSDAGTNSKSIDEANDRLEALMTRTEAAIQYVVPSVADVEVYEAMERMELLAQETERTLRYDALPMAASDLNEAYDRLEWLASKTENEIKYRVSEIEPVLLAEDEVGENNQENEHWNFLALFNANARKSR
jgi:hypothetical protein